MPGQVSGQDSSTALEPYSVTARTLHWLTVVLLVILFVTGFWIQELHESDPLRTTLRGLHRSVGLTTGLAAIIRILYRISHNPPALPAYMPLWQAELARTVQWVFYGLMIFMPLVGWGYANALGQTVHFWWLFNLPTIAGTHEETKHLLDYGHEYGAYLFMVLAAAHVIGALYHAVVKRDGVLTSMLFESRS